MAIYPKKYNKENFVKFLEKYNVTDSVIEKFNDLPETVERSGNTFELDITVTWYKVGNTHYTFELNYYSEELIEYLFSSKVFNNVEDSINNLLCELMNGNYIKKKGRICR